MKPLKDYIVDKDNNAKKLAEGLVTTMSYDLVTENDTNIDQEIKDCLIKKGWQYTIPEVSVISAARSRVVRNVDTPATTAWKEGVTPQQACEDFHFAKMAYDTNHVNDCPPRIARGIAFAVCGNVYDAVKFE